MPPIPANQLLNQHLDNVGIALRNKKPFTPGDFPAVQKYEQVIKDSPIEQAYMFDSTGMPVLHTKGNRRSVPFGRPDEGEFDAPMSLMTHNHPADVQQIPALSPGDLALSIEEQIPIRAVISKVGGVHEFSLHDAPLNEYVTADILSKMQGNRNTINYPQQINEFYPQQREARMNPKLMSENPEDYLAETKGDMNRAKGMVHWAGMENERDLDKASVYRQSPATLNTSYNLYTLPSSAPDATMAADSFAIQRKPKPLIAIEPGRSSAGSYDFDAAFAGMMNDRLARYGY